MNEIKTLDYEQLVADIGSILSEGRNRVASAINTTLVQTYWTIGRSDATSLNLSSKVKTVLNMANPS